MFTRIWTRPMIVPVLLLYTVNALLCKDRARQSKLTDQADIKAKRTLTSLVELLLLRFCDSAVDIWCTAAAAVTGEVTTVISDSRLSMQNALALADIFLKLEFLVTCLLLVRALLTPSTEILWWWEVLLVLPEDMFEAAEISGRPAPPWLMVVFPSQHTATL